ncbi:methyltransferase family protein [Aurantivibrio plasticivorans]
MKTSKPFLLPPIATALLFFALQYATREITVTLTETFKISAHIFDNVTCISLSAILSTISTLLIGISTFQFWRDRTSVNPRNFEGTQTLVVRGVFRLTRNPMYLGFFLLLVALGFFLDNIVSMIIAVFFIPVMTRLQIKPEEQYLKEKFGESYENYCANVRRWL